MITATHLSQQYRFRGRDISAVTDLSFSLDTGRILGLLGPNGAGKTTTLRMLATVSAPSSGTATIMGHDLATQPGAIRPLIGYVPQAGTLPRESVVSAEMLFQGQSFGLSTQNARKSGKEALARVGMEHLWNARAGRLSGGQRRRIDLAMSVMHHPAVALLDEPTVGLDPDARAEFWDLIRELRAEWGTTVIVSTHYLDEAESLADDILLMENGRIVEHGSTAELRERYAVDRVTLGVTHPLSDQAITELRALAGVRDAQLSWQESGLAGLEPRVELGLLHGSTLLPHVLGLLATHDTTVTSISMQPGGLSDAFFALIGTAPGTEISTQ